MRSLRHCGCELTRLETFSTTILKNIFQLQPLGSLFYQQGPRAVQLFESHGADMILARRSKSIIRLTEAAEALADRLLEYQESAPESLRKQYLRKIYQAMISVGNIMRIIKILAGVEPFKSTYVECLDGLLPAAAAAVGDLSTFKRVLRCEGDIFRCYYIYHEMILPSALQAAAALGNVDIVQWILSFVRAARAKVPGYYHQFPYHIVQRSRLNHEDYLIGAFVAAMHKRQHEVCVLITTRVCDDDKYTAYSHIRMDSAIQRCVKNGEADLLQKIFNHRKITKAGSSASTTSSSDPVISSLELGIIMNWTDVTTLDRMLQIGLLQPDRVGLYIPLYHAIIRLRYNLAQLLLDKGADINARDEHGVSVLERVVSDNCVRATQWLIENGANPAPVALSTPIREDHESFGLCKVAWQALRAAKPGAHK